MKAFSRLLDQLSFTPARNAKLTLLRDYLGGAPDPERGWALAALTGALALLRRMREAFWAAAGYVLLMKRPGERDPLESEAVDSG